MDVQVGGALFTNFGGALLVALSAGRALRLGIGADVFASALVPRFAEVAASPPCAAALLSEGRGSETASCACFRVWVSRNQMFFLVKPNKTKKRGTYHVHACMQDRVIAALLVQKCHKRFCCRLLGRRCVVKTNLQLSQEQTSYSHL